MFVVMCDLKYQNIVSDSFLKPSNLAKFLPKCKHGFCNAFIKISCSVHCIQCAGVRASVFCHGTKLCLLNVYNTGLRGIHNLKFYCHYSYHSALARFSGFWWFGKLTKWRSTWESVKLVIMMVISKWRLV
jgi:hypothetical protein